MSAFWFLRTRAARRRGGSLAGALALLLALAPTVGLGQAPVDQRLNLQVNSNVPTGRLMDANPQVGAAGRGYNYTRPVSPLFLGNTTASGVAGAGMSLQSFSPIGDPTAFHGSLGSGALSGFRRDSVSVASTPLGGGYLGQPYYDPSTTVPTAGFLQGYTAVTPPSSGLGTFDRRLQSRLSVQDSLRSQIVGLAAPAAPAAAPGPQSPPSPLTTSSTIFGVQPPPRLILPSDTEPPWRRVQPTEPGEREGLPGSTELPGGSADRRMPGSEPLASPLSGLLRTELYPRGGQAGQEGARAAEAARPGLVLPPWDRTVALEARPPTIVDPRVLPGYDVLTDTQLALDLMSDPNPTWFQDMRRALHDNPELAKQVDEHAAQDAAQFLEEMLHAPLRSLTGKGPSALNDHMLKAEALMQMGHYSEAVDRYEAARMAEIANPLPLIGKGHALLAQGNYHSAALALLAGIDLADRYPGLAPILLKRLDLSALMGGGEIIDIRRADLMRRLEERESPELRFLLGYLEYHSGDRARGLANLKRAAENRLAGPVIARYPALLAEEEPRIAPVEPQPAPAPRPAEPAEKAKTPSEDLVIPPRVP